MNPVFPEDTLTEAEVEEESRYRRMGPVIVFGLLVLSVAVGFCYSLLYGPAMGCTDRPYDLFFMPLWLGWIAFVAVLVCVSVADGWLAYRDGDNVFDAMKKRPADLVREVTHSRGYIVLFALLLLTIQDRLTHFSYSYHDAANFVRVHDNYKNTWRTYRIECEGEENGPD